MGVKARFSLPAAVFSEKCYRYMCDGLGASCIICYWEEYSRHLSGLECKGLETA